jgi:hypothetical protein
MFRITISAKRQLRDIAEGRSLEPGRYLRLAVPPEWAGEGDFGIVIDGLSPLDTEVEYQGKTVLLVGPSVDERLPDAVLDYKRAPSQPRFTLDVFGPRPDDAAEDTPAD